MTSFIKTLIRRIYRLQQQHRAADTVLKCNQNPNEPEEHLKTKDLNGLG